MVKMPLVPALKRNSGEIQLAVHYWKQNAVRREEAFPFPNIADHLPKYLFTDEDKTEELRDKESTTNGTEKTEKT